MMKSSFAITIVMFALVSSLCYGSQGFEYVVDNHTLALWHMNEGNGDKIADASRNKFDGKVEGNVRWGKEGWKQGGAAGHSFVFDGSTRINLGHVKELIMPKSNSITVEAWVNPQDLSQKWHVIYSNWSGPSAAYHFACRFKVPHFFLKTDKGMAEVTGGGRLKLGTWYHMAGTYDSKTGDVKLYVDGKLVAKKAGHGGKITDNNLRFDVVIGSKDNFSLSWKGTIDEVRISDIARTPIELSPNLGAPGKSVSPLGSLCLTWGAIKGVWIHQ